MHYLYHKSSGSLDITLRGDEHRYIFKVRREREGSSIFLRNLVDDMLYRYRILSITKREAILTLEGSEKLIVDAKRGLNIGWCIIEPKNIEKVLPTLNEIGVDSISFIYCKRSQKSFRVDLKRLNKILLNSSQQSGRSRLMRLEVLSSLDEFKTLYPNAKMVNFSKNRLEGSEIDSLVIGCEGGFTDDEVTLFGDSVVGFDTPLTLKSESAVVAAASKLLI